MRLLPFALCLICCGVSACGGAVVGGGCNATGFLCDSATTALECRDNVWTELPCKGPGGCALTKDAQNKETVKCDMRLNTAGDACASSAENKGICSADGKAVYECRSGFLAQTATCSSCTVQADKISCAP
ncbi:MAG: hypothetical protein ACT4TC_14515 [Myxococcaceae bacterium]